MWYNGTVENVKNGAPLPLGTGALLCRRRASGLQVRPGPYRFSELLEPLILQFGKITFGVRAHVDEEIAAVFPRETVPRKQVV